MGLLEDKLAACVSIIEKVESFFRWQGKVNRAKEVLLVIKSEKSKLPRLIKSVRAMHSYEVPEIIALSLAGGYKPYLEWVRESIG